MTRAHRDEDDHDPLADFASFLGKSGVTPRAAAVAADSHEGARWRRIIEWLIGRRAVDLPMRLVGVLLAATAIMPGAVEAQEPVFLLLFFISRLLLIAAPFAPAAAGALAGGFFLLHLFMEPTLLNPFAECLAFAFGALLATGCWRLAVPLCMGSLGLSVLESWVAPAVGSSVPVFAFTWGLVALLGLFALLFDKRIEAESTRREAAAAAHARAVEQLRINVAIDTHDTISHGLATQAAILRVLSAERSISDLRRGLGELAMVNDQTQQNLRSLLHGLRSTQNDLPSETAPNTHLLQGVDSLTAAAGAGGYTLRTKVDLPAELPSIVLAEQLLLISRELVTNIVKHASSRDGARLSLYLSGCGAGRHVVIEAENRAAVMSGAEEVSGSVPRSIADRIERLGGSFRSAQIGGRFLVTVTVPWNALTAGHPSSEG